MHIRNVLFYFWVSGLLTSLAILGCTVDTPEAPSGSAEITADDMEPQTLGEWVYSEWSEPKTIGPPVNSIVDERNCFLSTDELTLYFTSMNRNGGKGLLDIWFSKRRTKNDPWGTPENLEIANTLRADFAPSLSIDGLLLFFTSVTETPRSADIYLSRRSDPRDDYGWGPPARLDAGVNTDDDAEQAPFFLGPFSLYFNRGSMTSGLADIYRAAVNRRGETLLEAVPVAALNSPANDFSVTIRRDGRELFFTSSRGGTPELYTSTRPSVFHQWSQPVPLGEPLNTPGSTELAPHLSFDGRTLIYVSDRLPSEGGQDLWISTRTLEWRPQHKRHDKDYRR
jgi:hypothetical protein